MNYLVTANTDIGTTRKTNQDSIAVLTADTAIGTAAFGIVCDGMGGLAKGEMASATLLHAFIKWFKEVFPKDIETGITDGLIREQWNEIICEQNEIIKTFGNAHKINLGTTVAVILITDQRYYITNVGDSRVYEIYTGVKQLTEDQTVVARELKYGRLTDRQAQEDPRKNVLLQCVGASKTVKPDFFFGATVTNAIYMLCSDGFRHYIAEKEMLERFSAEKNTSVEDMNGNSLYLIEENKKRMEKDNISVVLIRTF